MKGESRHSIECTIRRKKGVSCSRTTLKWRITMNFLAEQFTFIVTDSTGMVLLLIGIGMVQALRNAPRIKSKDKVLYNEKASAWEDIEHAIKKASKEHKHILLVLGANWCPWCRALNRLLTRNITIKKVIEKHYEMVLVDMGFQNKNIDINEQYENPMQLGLPVFVILDERGDRLTAQNTTIMECKGKKRKRHQPGKVLGFLKRWAPR